MADAPQGKSRAPQSVEELNAALGIRTTPEGLARARRELDEHRRAMTPERWNRLREKLGMAPKPVVS